MSDEYKVITDITSPKPIQGDEFEKIEDFLMDNFSEIECETPAGFVNSIMHCEGTTNLASGPPNPKMDRGLFDDMSQYIKSVLPGAQIKSCFTNLDQCNFTREA